MMMEAVLMSFEIDGDLEARAAFSKKWNEAGQGSKGIRATVIRTFSSRKSAIGGVAKTELFRLLDVPKLPKNASAEEVVYRRARMEALQSGAIYPQLESLNILTFF